MSRRLLVMSLLAAVLALPGSALARSVFGIHTAGDPFDGTTQRVDDLQRSLGRHIAVVAWFQSWGGDSWSAAPQPRLIRTVLRSHRLPLLTWEPWQPGAGPWQSHFSLARVAGGDFDAYMARWARGLRRFRSPVYLRPMHEMNGDWYPWGGTVNNNSPALFKAAWRRMVTIFRREGASNVRFVWCPINQDWPIRPSNRLERYYPGPNYVDVFAMDGYNWGAARPEFGGWRSFRATFMQTYRRLERLGRQPIWIPEVGSTAVGGNKAAWVRGMFAQARRMPRLRAIIWMDTVADGGDWRAESPVGTAAAFRLRH